MNCLRIGTSEPTYQDFIYEISNATRESLIDQSNIGLTDFNPLQALLTDSALEHTGGASSAHFVDLFPPSNRRAESRFNQLLYSTMSTNYHQNRS